MKGFGHTTLFTTEQIKLRDEVAAAVESLPELALLNSHELARAVFTAFAIDGAVVDGGCAGVEHSWISLQQPSWSAYKILDVYSIVRLPMVQLIDLGPTMLSRLFVPYDPTSDRAVRLRRQVDVVYVALLVAWLREYRETALVRADTTK